MCRSTPTSTTHRRLRDADDDNASVQVLIGRPYPTRYAMSGFYIEMGGVMYAAAIDARHRTGHRRHDMAAEFQ